MKRKIGSLFIGVILIILSPLSSSADALSYPPNSNDFNPLTEEEMIHRREVFEKVNMLPTYADRIATIRTYFDENAEYTKEFIDSALHWAMHKGTPAEQAQAHFDFFDYYGMKSNRTGTKHVLENITQIARAHPSIETYYFYFQAWTLRLQSDILVGRTEEARFDVEAMLKEAEQLNNNDGRFFAYFLSILLLHNDKSSANNPPMLAYLERAKEIPNLSLMQQRWLESRYYMYYMRTGEKEQARNSLTKEIELLKETIVRHPERERKLQPMFLRNYVRLSALYEREKESDSIKYYLEMAQPYYKDSLSIPAYIGYQLAWAKYYDVQHDWKRSIIHYDKALVKGKKQHPRFLTNILIAKAEVLEKLGKEREAAILYHKIVLQKDSLNHVTLKSHQIAYEKNFQIEQLLQKQLTRQQLVYRVVIIAMIVLAMAIAYFIYLVLRSEKIIKFKREQIKKLYADVEKENKVKSFLLENVVHEIQTPLEKVVTCADKLSIEKRLPHEERNYYATQIREQSQRILTLVLNVLDLSRLEVGMVKYKHKKQNLVSLCQEIVEEVRAEQKDSFQIDFQSNYQTIVGEVDAIYMRKMVIHLLKVPCQLTLASLHTTCYLTYSKGVVILKVINSPLSLLQLEESEIERKIIKLIISQLGGEYYSNNSEEGVVIELRLPMLLTDNLA